MAKSITYFSPSHERRRAQQEVGSMTSAIASDGSSLLRGRQVTPSGSGTGEMRGGAPLPPTSSLLTSPPTGGDYMGASGRSAEDLYQTNRSSITPSMTSSLNGNGGSASRGGSQFNAW